MNLLNKNELLKLLDSPDIENRKIAETYLLANFDLDFKVTYGINTFTLKPFCEINNGNTEWFTHSVKKLLYWIINDKFSKRYLNLILDTIYEYNNK